MTRKEEFKLIYSYLQGKLSSNPAYEFRPKRKDREKLDEFLSNDKVGNLWEYLTFQFNRQMFVLTLSNLPIVPLMNVIGKTAIDRWRKRTKRDIYFTSKFVMENELFNPIESEEGISESYLDEQRKLYFDSPEGYILCDSFDGYLLDEEKCKGCRYILLCKEKWKDKKETACGDLNKEEKN